MLLPKWSLFLLATILIATAAIAQQAQLQSKQIQVTANAFSSEDVKPTCASVDSGSDAALTPAREFDVFRVERSLGLSGERLRSAGAGSDKPGPELLICCSKSSRCPGCHQCGREEAWDCTLCGCQPI